jgi:hypothetical protein
MGEPVRPFLGALGVFIDTQHIMSKTDERVCDCTTEPREADDDDVVIGRVVASQR